MGKLHVPHRIITWTPDGMHIDKEQMCDSFAEAIDAFNRLKPLPDQKITLQHGARVLRKLEPTEG